MLTRFVVKDNETGKHYEFHRRMAVTEYQIDCEDDIQMTEVKKVKKTVEIETWEPVN